MAKRNPENAGAFLTIDRLWNIHKDVSYVYFIYEDRHIENGLLLRWEKDRIQIQKKGEYSPRFISLDGLKSIKVVIGNRVWESLVAGAAAATGFFLLTGADNVRGESYGEVGYKVFGSPLIVMASIAIGSSMEKTEELIIPGGFSFDYDDVKLLYELSE